MLISLVAQKKDDHGPEIGYGYTRYQVEQAFKDAEVFLRFWEPQKGVNLRSGEPCHGKTFQTIPLWHPMVEEDCLFRRNENRLGLANQ